MVETPVPTQVEPCCSSCQRAFPGGGRRHTKQLQLYLSMSDLQKCSRALSFMLYVFSPPSVEITRPSFESSWSQVNRHFAACCRRRLHMKLSAPMAGSFHLADTADTVSGGWFQVLLCTALCTYCHFFQPFLRSLSSSTRSFCLNGMKLPVFRKLLVVASCNAKPFLVRGWNIQQVWAQPHHIIFNHSRTEYSSIPTKNWKGAPSINNKSNERLPGVEKWRLKGAGCWDSGWCKLPNWVRKTWIIIIRPGSILGMRELLLKKQVTPQKPTACYPTACFQIKRLLEVQSFTPTMLDRWWFMQLGAQKTLTRNGRSLRPLRCWGGSQVERLVERRPGSLADLPQRVVRVLPGGWIVKESLICRNIRNPYVGIPQHQTTCLTRFRRFRRWPFYDHLSSDKRLRQALLTEAKPKEAANGSKVRSQRWVCETKDQGPPHPPTATTTICIAMWSIILYNTVPIVGMLAWTHPAVI